MRRRRLQPTLTRRQRLAQQEQQSVYSSRAGLADAADNSGDLSGNSVSGNKLSLDGGLGEVIPGRGGPVGGPVGPKKC